MAGAADAQDNITPITVPSWGGMELQGLTVENDFRELDVAVPLPAVPYMPKLSFHRHAYETKGRFGGWQKGGARVLAHLPFGLELEAGHRLDRLGRRESEFVGLTFNYSHLQDHHENWHYGRLGANRGASMPEHIGTHRGKFHFGNLLGLFFWELLWPSPWTLTPKQPLLAVLRVGNCQAITAAEAAAVSVQAQHQARA